MGWRRSYQGTDLKSNQDKHDEELVVIIKEGNEWLISSEPERALEVNKLDINWNLIIAVIPGLGLIKT